MKAILKPSNMFHTPEDWDALTDWINRHPREDRIHLITAAMMAWNLAAKLTEPETQDA